MKLWLGQRFDRWIVVAKAVRSQHWICKCDCGSQKEVFVHSLLRGLSRSCGCLTREVSRARHLTHGLSHSITAISWYSMLRRCTDEKFKHYKYYGGRGIRVCDQWKSFENFLADMGERPSRDYSIDRFPNKNGNYEPGNCRWATRSEQQLNKRPYTRKNHAVVAG